MESKRKLRWVLLGILAFVQAALLLGDAIYVKMSGTIELSDGRFAFMLVFRGLLVAGSTAFVVFLLVRADRLLAAEAAARMKSALRSRIGVITGMAKLAESRDDDTGRHLDRIRYYVHILAEELAKTNPEIDAEMIETICETSALHDIGKVGIPDSVLLKPGRFTDDEYAVIKKHPTIGGDTLLALKRKWGDDQFLVVACEIALAHHEKWDGTGYPYGLSGETIPLSARIVALADVYDALTTKRVYKPAMTHAEAGRIIKEGSGTHFDPQVVAAFERRGSDFESVMQRERDPETRFE